MDFLRNKEN